ncbi:MAG: DUF1385 domain-containing protein, partial [Oscillospiraceae bacterium]|nr:DUF1385 domain-containing protein [Oscillospiraceae bacterium]
MANKDNCKTKFKTSIGGQALIEGILMRGPTHQSMVCRKPDGELAVQVDELSHTKEKYPILGKPFIRGGFMLISSMKNGMKAITWSAEFMPEEDQEEPGKFDLGLEKKLGSEKAEKVIMGVAMVIGILLAIGLFFLLPAFLFELLPDSIGLVGRCILEGIIRIIIFLLYLWFATRMKEIKRLFAYHGAEHKSIYCYEKGLPLTVENVRMQSRFHPRCGTSFLVVVMIISIFVISFMTWVLSLFPAIEALPGIVSALIRMGCKLLLLPIIVGITYEINRWVGGHDGLLSDIIAWPGKMTHHITTSEPEDDMIEVAIEALKLV